MESETPVKKGNTPGGTWETSFLFNNNQIAILNY